MQNSSVASSTKGDAITQLGRKSLKTLIFLALVVAAVAFFTGALKRKGSAARDETEPRFKHGGRTPITRKTLVTEREQGMYNRLAVTFPNHVVLAQVAFSALVATKGNPTRATFDRKVADFVLCNKAFDVIAVIELDDSTHRGKEERDAARDAMLRDAGYTALRYANTPDADVLLRDISRATKPAPAAPRMAAGVSR